VVSLQRPLRPLTFNVETNNCHLCGGFFVTSRSKLTDQVQAANLFFRYQRVWAPGIGKEWHSSLSRTHNLHGTQSLHGA
jgi:hypothetical protein